MSVNLYNATTDTLKNVAGDIINVHSVNEMVAPVEEGDTASRAYSEGEQFIINGILYYAMTNIAQGEAFDYDVNYYESPTVSDQINDKQDKTDNSLTTTSKTVIGAINELNSGKQDKLTNPLTQADVVDALTSTSTTTPLSAKQGKELKTLIDDTAKLSSQNNFTAGSIVHENSIDLSNPPASDTWGSASFPQFQDKNNQRFSYIQPLQKANGAVDTHVKTDVERNPDGKVLVDGYSAIPWWAQYGSAGQVHIYFSPENPQRYLLGSDYIDLNFDSAAITMTVYRNGEVALQKRLTW